MTSLNVLYICAISLVFAALTWGSAIRSLAQVEASEGTESAAPTTQEMKETTFDSRSAPADVRDAIDRALRDGGDLGVYGDLSGGLPVLEKMYQVTIHQTAHEWHLSLAPMAGEGHDFSLTIIAATGEVRDVVVGEVAPPPEW